MLCWMRPSQKTEVLAEGVEGLTRSRKTRRAKQLGVSWLSRAPECYWHCNRKLCARYCDLRLLRCSCPTSCRTVLGRPEAGSQTEPLTLGPVAGRSHKGTAT